MKRDLVITYKEQNSRTRQNLEKYKALDIKKCFNYKKFGYFRK